MLNVSQNTLEKKDILEFSKNDIQEFKKKKKWQNQDDIFFIC